ncbi:MAG TPA: hypothetical protein VLJ42_04730 [Solirubrobacteraceae bacterium]|nr:hypothetical protein [Solirubrobacteraceae bacterium]
MLDELVERVVAAHGGLALWENASEISLRISSGGFAFGLKSQGSAVRDVEARVSTTNQRVVFERYPKLGQRGVLEPDGSVRIETDDGEVLESRQHARAAFNGLRHQLWWDRLDILYFAAYAIWTYVSTPFVFAGGGYELRELEPWQEHDERWERLAVRFPQAIHTHSREQVFYVDAAGLIRRHDYTAEPFGGWAKAAHYCSEHQSFDGLIVPTRRAVYPRKRDNRPRARPRLVWIELADVALRA